MQLEKGRTVPQRLSMCRDLLAARENLARAANDIRARVLVNHRANAIRRALLGSRGAAPDLADELLSPAHTAERLTAILDDLETKTGAERQRGALYVAGIAAVMSTLMRAEAKLNVLAGAVDYQGLANRARAMGADNAEGNDHVIDASIDAGKFGDDVREELASVSVAGERYKKEMAAAIEASQALYAYASREDGEFRDRYNELMKISDGAERASKINALYDEWDVFRKKVLEPAQESERTHAIAVVDAEKNARAAVGRKIIARLMEASTVTQEQADAWAAAQEITPQAKARLRKIGYAVDDVRRDMAEFYRITGGRLPGARIHSNGSRRANATDIESHGKVGTINLDSSFDKRVLWHELGHHLEADPVAKAAAARFIRRRSVDGKVYTLRGLTGNRGYGPREVALKGNFFSPYVGKVYSDGVTEVFSMGVETFSDPALLAKRATDDTQTMEFITGYLAQPLDDLGRAHMRLREILREATDDAAEQVEAEVENIVAEVSKQAKFVPSEDRSWMERYDWMYESFIVKGYFDIGGGKWWALAGKVRPWYGRKVNGFQLVKPHDGGMNRKIFPSKDFELLKVAMVKFERTGQFDSDIDHLKNDTSLKALAA